MRRLALFGCVLLACLSAANAKPAGGRLVYEIVVTSPGSRSQGWHGTLYGQDGGAIDVPAGLAVTTNALISDVVQSALEEAGFGVLLASTGATAIELLESSEGSAIRAVVTDINLGRGTDGWQVARRAREINPRMPLVYVTGGNADEWAVNGVPRSVLINKPFAPAQVVTAVAQALNAEQPVSDSQAT